MNLSSTARLSLLLTSMSRIGIQCLQLITFVIAARWLTPADYGTYAIVTLVVTLLTLFNDFGLQAALVHESDPSPSRLSTAFWLNLTVGLTFSALIALTAIPAGHFLSYPDLGLALAVAGLGFGCSLTVVPSALLQRQLRLGLLAIVEFLGNLVGSVLALTLAWKGVGVVSLSVGPVVTAVVITAALGVLTRYLPRARPSVVDLRALWGFSGSLLGTNAAYYVFRNVDTIVLTAVSSPQQLGLYSRAYSLVSAPVTQAGAVIGRVLFPILARSRDAPELLRDRWLRTTFASFSILLPVSIAFAITSPYIVRVLFEPRWYPMASIISVLSVAVPARLLCNAMGPVYQATGHTGPLLRVTLIQGVGLAIGVGTGAIWGPVGVAWGVVVATNVCAYIPLAVGLRYMDMTVIGLLNQFKWVLFAGSIQSCVMLAFVMSGYVQSTEIALAACLMLGIITYLAVARITDRRFFHRIVGKPARHNSNTA